MKKKIGLFTLPLLFAFNVFAQDASHKLPKDIEIIPNSHSKSVSIAVKFLHGEYIISLPEGYFPGTEFSDSNSKTVLSFPKGQNATSYKDAITLSVYKKAYPGNDYINKTDFQAWLKEEANMKCPLGKNLFPVSVSKDKYNEFAVGSFSCNYIDESKKDVIQARTIIQKQLNNTYYMVTASTKKPKSQIKTKTDLDNLIKQSQNLLVETKPIIGCPDENNLNQCLDDFSKKFLHSK